MKKFNPDRELYKIKYGKRNKIILSIFLLLVVISIGSTYALYQVRHSKRIIYTTVSDFSKDIELAVYVNGNKQDSFPTNKEGVVYSETICDKKGITTANWNSEEWKIDIVSTGPNKCKVYFNEGKEFSYNGEEGSDGSVQTYKVPKSGTYKLEVWGAQGGSLYGGKGGYATGNITLTQNQTLYIVVGGQGNTREGGYNGGGKPDVNPTYRQGVTYGGGGATHIALVNGELKNLSTQQSQVLIVAGGGGGGSLEYAGSKEVDLSTPGGNKNGQIFGGAGGGEEGAFGCSWQACSRDYGYNGFPGKSTLDSTCESYGVTDRNCGGFGYGGDNNDTAYGGAGGGSGWYGGSNSDRGHAGGGGGSGHLGTSLTDGRMETGVREGNGLVRITLIKTN